MDNKKSPAKQSLTSRAYGLPFVDCAASLKLTTGLPYFLDFSDEPPREERYAGLLGFSWLERLSAADLLAALFGFLEFAFCLFFLAMVVTVLQLNLNGNSHPH